MELFPFIIVLGLVPNSCKLLGMEIFIILIHDLIIVSNKKGLIAQASSKNKC